MTNAHTPSLVWPNLLAPVYSATYVTANVADCWRSSVTTKFAAVTAVNMRCASLQQPRRTALQYDSTTDAHRLPRCSLCSASVLKDAAYARMFGGMAASGPVPLASYALFALRDCLTVGAGFILPGAVAEAARSAGAGDGKAAKRGAQLAGPSAMQVRGPSHRQRSLASHAWRLPAGHCAFERRLTRCFGRWSAHPCTFLLYPLRQRRSRTRALASRPWRLCFHRRSLRAPCECSPRTASAAC